MKSYLTLQPTEKAILEAAAGIYAAYIGAGRVDEGQEDAWMKRSIQEAIRIARTIDEVVQADKEVD